MVFGEQNLERRIARVDCLVQELPEQYRARERDFILEWLDGGSARSWHRDWRTGTRSRLWQSKEILASRLVRKARGQATRSQTSFLMWRCMQP